jgi:NAD-dependent DNA ligase
MSLKKMYEKISGLIALELFDAPDVKKDIEKEFAGELTNLRNIEVKTVATLSREELFDMLRIYDVFFRAGDPLITDEKYDEFYTYYEDPDTEPVMFETSIGAWEKAEHDIPMGSLGKCNNIDEIEAWNARKEVAPIQKVISEKLDGISLEVIYEKGEFVRAVTRGDGKEGDDITLNAIHFDGMVKELGECMDCAVRGEVVILKENLHNINAILVEKGKEPLKNTRNGVAGQATKFKDRDEKILEMITFIAYEIQVFAMHETGEVVA